MKPATSVYCHIGDKAMWFRCVMSLSGKGSKSDAMQKAFRLAGGRESCESRRFAYILRGSSLVRVESNKRNMESPPAAFKRAVLQGANLKERSSDAGAKTSGDRGDRVDQGALRPERPGAVRRS